MTKDTRKPSGSGYHRHVTGGRGRDTGSARAGRLLLLMVACMALGAAPRAAAAQPLIERVSVNSQGHDGEGNSNTPALNDDASAVAFGSDALNLVSPRKANHVSDVYVRVREGELRSTERVSVGFDGASPDSGSQASGFAPGISGSGRFISFHSSATNLVSDDTNGFDDVFVADRQTGVTERISLGVDGEANGASTFARISADGRYVVFQSAASNLVEGDDNNRTDIFLFDRETRVTHLVSVSSQGGQGNGISITPDISGDGRVIAFASAATNLVQGDMNGVVDIFVQERESGTTERVSLSSTGLPANRASFLPALSFDGTLVAFKSEAFNLVPDDTNGVPDVFVRSRVYGETERVSVDNFGNQSNDLSGAPGISADGRFVAFVSFSSTFDPEDGNGFSDVFVFDRDVGEIARVTVEMTADGGRPGGNVPDFPPSVSADGKWIGFASAAENLVPNDINNSIDAFIACNPLPSPFDPARCVAPPLTPGPRPCVGDCDDDGEVTVNELIRMVNMALGTSVCGEGEVQQCLAGDSNCDCEITVDEIIQGVNNTLGGCTRFGACSLPEHEALCCGPLTLD